MSEKSQNAMSGALTGAVLAATAAWSRYDDDTQRRLNNVRDDARDALNLVRDVQSRGEAIRSRLAVVQDVQVGFAVANAAEPTSSVVPTATPIARPNIFDSMEVAIGDLSYPPQPGVYDARGMVQRVGEMTALGLALTFEEVRAFVQGLVQEKSPSRDGKIQIFYAAQTLIRTVKDLKLTWLDYLNAWQRLFGVPLTTVAGSGAGSGGTSPAPANIHTSVQTPPTVTSMDPGVASIKPLGLPELPSAAYKHNNTDSANKWQIAVAGANINAGATVAQMAFGQTYLKGGDPYQPVVTVNDPRFQVTNVTASGFQLVNYTQLSANGIYNIFISVTAGCC